MQKFVTKEGVKTKEITREWILAEKQWQKELTRIKRLCWYDWNNKTDSIIETATREYKAHREKFAKIFGDGEQ